VTHILAQASHGINPIDPMTKVVDDWPSGMRISDEVSEKQLALPPQS
jgi:hypothetical protein